MVFLIVGRASSASADENHYNNILVGDRASSMGGAYTAISDDTSGLFHNPAGVVYTTGGNLSASVNAYQASKKTYKKALGGRFDWKRESSVILPNFFGIVQSLGKGKIGISYAITDSTIENQNQTFEDFTGCKGACTVNHFAVNVLNEENVTNIGPSYARGLSKDFSLGVSLFMHQRAKHEIFNQFLIIDSNSYQLINSNNEDDELGIRPVLGLMWSPLDKVSVGLSVSKTALFYANQSRRLIYDTTFDDPATAVNEIATFRIQADADAVREYPWSGTLGVAYFPTEALLLSGDFSYFTAVPKKTFDLPATTYLTTGQTTANINVDSFEERLATWNAALGLEYFIISDIALRAGVFTNRSNSPEPVEGETSGLEHIDLYGGSTSVSYFSRNSSLTLGSSYSYGTGKAQVVSGTGVQDANAYTWAVFLSSSYVY